MSRKKRVDYDGAVHHIMCKGNNGEFILSDDSAKRKYLDLIAHYKKQYNVKILAYCIMNNHVHLLVKSGENHIGKMMRIVQTRFAKWYNKKHNRFGVVFCGRYKNSICVGQRYLLNLLRYIHLNPVKANVSKCLNYQFSSYSDLMLKRKNGYADVDDVYQMIDSNMAKAKKRFSRIMQSTIKQEIALAVKKVKSRGINDLNYLNQLINHLDYKLQYLQGPFIPDYLKVIRTSFVGIIKENFKINDTLIAMFFKLSTKNIRNMLTNYNQSTKSQLTYPN